MSDFKDLVQKAAAIIRETDRGADRLLIAIEGRCAAGKTTLASELARILSCNVIHMDHFFLRPEQRTRERLETPGENVDHERFLREVLIPLRKGERVSYRPYDCETMELGKPIFLENRRINIMEGSYSCHNMLREYYDIRIFLNVSPEEQMRRITARNGADGAEMFRSKWIPLEEAYFSAFDIAGKCDYCFSSDR